MRRQDRTMDIQFVVTHVDELQVGGVDVQQGTVQCESFVESREDKTADIEIGYVGMQVDLGNYAPERNVDVSIENVDIQLDLVDYEHEDYQMSVVIGEMYKGEDGYTPQKGIDYWTQEDINDIHQYIDDQGYLVTKVVERLPIIGLPNVIYQLHDGQGGFTEYIWNSGGWNVFGDNTEWESIL